MSLGRIVVPNVPIVLNIKSAHDTRHLLIVVSGSFLYCCRAWLRSTTSAWCWSTGPRRSLFSKESSSTVSHSKLKTLNFSQIQRVDLLPAAFNTYASGPLVGRTWNTKLANWLSPKPLPTSERALTVTTQRTRASLVYHSWQMSTSSKCNKIKRVSNKKALIKLSRTQTTTLRTFSSLLWTWLLSEKLWLLQETMASFTSGTKRESCVVFLLMRAAFLLSTQTPSSA